MQITEDLVRRLVIEVVDKLEELQREAEIKEKPHLQDFQGKVLTASELEFLHRNRVEVLRLSKKTILTPLARERAQDLGVTLEFCD
jgi:hypothetical protein